jgi:hypothetical protein
VKRKAPSGAWLKRKKDDIRGIKEKKITPPGSETLSLFSLPSCSVLLGCAVSKNPGRRELTCFC